MIGTTAEKIIAQIKLCLSHSRQITIRTDLWSTRCSNESFIGVTSHSYNPKMRKRQSFKLCKLLIFLIVSLLPALLIICISKLRVISRGAHRGGNIREDTGDTEEVHDRIECGLHYLRLGCQHDCW